MYTTVYKLYTNNRTDYDAAGEISETEVAELIGEANNFYPFSKDLISKKYPQYL